MLAVPRCGTVRRRPVRLRTRIAATTVTTAAQQYQNPQSNPHQSHNREDRIEPPQRKPRRRRSCHRGRRLQQHPHLRMENRHRRCRRRRSGPYKTLRAPLPRVRHRLPSIHHHPHTIRVHPVRHIEISFPSRNLVHRLARTGNNTRATRYPGKGVRRGTAGDDIVARCVFVRFRSGSGVSGRAASGRAECKDRQVVPPWREALSGSPDAARHLVRPVGPEQRPQREGGCGDRASVADAIAGPAAEGGSRA